MPRRTVTQKRSRAHVGDVGILRLGGHRIKVRVIEDRGFIGKDGRQLVRVIRLNRLDDESRDFEMPAEELLFSRPKKVNARR